MVLEVLYNPGTSGCTSPMRPTNIDPVYIGSYGVSTLFPEEKGIRILSYRCTTKESKLLLKSKPRRFVEVKLSYNCNESRSLKIGL